jgi:hypothetical protein
MYGYPASSDERIKNYINIASSRQQLDCVKIYRIISQAIEIKIFVIRVT